MHLLRNVIFEEIVIQSDVVIILNAVWELMGDKMKFEFVIPIKTIYFLIEANEIAF